MPWGSNSPPPPFIHEFVAVPIRDAQPFVAADGPPAPCKFNAPHGPPQNNTLGIYKIFITLDVNHALRHYSSMAIKSFKCAETECLFQRLRVKRFVNIEAVARRKLEQLEWAEVLDDLRVPPGNRLEALKGNRAGQHSIRINDQFRVCFVWTAEGARNVEIVDYH